MGHLLTLYLKLFTIFQNNFYYFFLPEANLWETKHILQHNSHVAHFSYFFFQIFLPYYLKIQWLKSSIAYCVQNDAKQYKNYLKILVILKYWSNKKLNHFQKWLITKSPGRHLWITPLVAQDGAQIS